ncbi:MAG: hypothetical protein Q8R25_03685, partial [bacterium]|nr:hypothetical protein [bacterium]
SVFIVREGRLTKEVAKKLATFAERSELFEKKSIGNAKEAFEVFSLANALARRDRKQLWVLYQKAKREGIDDAAIQGILFWKVKTMIMARDTRAYSEEELIALARDLITIVFRARRGKFTLADGLERFILTFSAPSGGMYG